METVCLSIHTSGKHVHDIYTPLYTTVNSKKVQVGKDQEKAQSETDSHSKNRGGKKTKFTITRRQLGYAGVYLFFLFLLQNIDCGVCRGIPIFLIFAPKQRLWVLVRTASAKRF